jgi:hypothetical protein
MSKDNNRRRFHRFPFDAEAILIVDGQERLPCDLMDLSINGALLTLKHSREGGAGRSAVLDLVLRGLVRNDRAEIQGKVEAVWQRGNRLGCRFVGVDPVSFSNLKTLIEDNLGNPCLLDRELTQLTYWPGVERSSIA